MRSKSVELMDKIKCFAQEYYMQYLKSPSTAQISNALGISRGTAYRYLVEMGQKGMISYDGKNIETDVTRKYTDSWTNAVILDGSVSCGVGINEEEAVLEYARLPKTVFGNGELFLIRANGDSMVDAGIDDGDWVVVKRQSTAKEGDIVVAFFEGLSNLKYFYIDREKGCAVLRSANKQKAYEDIEVYDLDVQGVAQSVIKGL